MVATLSPVSSAKNSGKYFYFTESNYECSKSWHNNRAKEELALKSLNRRSFENILDGKLNKDTVLGRKTKDGLKHHPGQELILSAPKSVSIMALVAKDERVVEAHERSVSTTLDYIQRHMIYTRVQEKGKQSIEKTDNAPIARFTHMTSRTSKSKEQEEKAPDPQLHTHNIIANATFCKDNTWRSIVFDSLYENQLNIGELYRMELAREVEKLGYDTEFTRNRAGLWTFEIKGVSDKDIQEFSQRRKGILEEAEKIGNNSTETLAYIAKITREEKQQYNRDNLENNWIARCDIDSIFKLKEQVTLAASAAAPNKEQEMASNLEYALKNGIDSLSEREATFTPEDLHASIINNTKNEYSVLQIEDAVSKKIESGSILLSKYSETHTYTTAKNLKLEKDTVKFMLNGQNRVKAIFTQK